MTRLPPFAIALLLTLAPAAHGEAVGLRDDLHAEQVALAGPDVLVARELPNERVQLYAVPRTGPDGRVGPGGRGSSELTVKGR